MAAWTTTIAIAGAGGGANHRQSCPIERNGREAFTSLPFRCYGRGRAPPSCELTRGCHCLVTTPWIRAHPASREVGNGQLEGNVSPFGVREYPRRWTSVAVLSGATVPANVQSSMTNGRLVAVKTSGPSASWKCRWGRSSCRCCPAIPTPGPPSRPHRSGRGCSPAASGHRRQRPPAPAPARPRCRHSPAAGAPSSGVRWASPPGSRRGRRRPSPSATASSSAPNAK